jgi:S1-C subfamily serine protease
VPRKLATCRCGASPSEREDGEPAPAAQSGHPVPRAAFVLAALVLVSVAWIIASRRTVPLATGHLAERALAVAPPAASGDAPALSWPSDVPYMGSATPADVRTSAQPAPTKAEPPLASRAIEDIVASSVPAVVLIESPGGRGTGFFVASDRVVTNAHVVQQSGYVTVVTGAGARIPARVVTFSPAQDLAILSLADAPPGQPVLPLGTLENVRVGQEVLAIGSPLGFQNTVTRGIVSAVRRAGDVALVQTDAAINPGNSGGPLLDRAGRVIAVTTMKIAGSAESLGFGVSVDHVRPLLDGRTAGNAAKPGPLPTAQPSGAAEPEEGDERLLAEAEYERAVAEIARRADALDGEWTRFVGSCLPQPPRRGGDRGWFSIWDRSFDERAVAPACAGFFADYKQSAAAVRSRLADADEAARRAGVYPGTRRAILARHRLQWDGDR